MSSSELFTLVGKRRWDVSGRCPLITPHHNSMTPVSPGVMEQVSSDNLTTCLVSGSACNLFTQRTVRLIPRQRLNELNRWSVWAKTQRLSGEAAYG